MAATEDTMGTLHDAVVSLLLSKVQDGTATPAELSTCVKMLKDNNIQAIPTENNKLGKLALSLPDFDTDEESLHARH
tara:strand:+ start:207 stop:437 length:231 start_codon:yes stop_codon:yes gene_type:complete